METILYQNASSSSSWRVRWALLVKNVPHRLEAVNLGAGEQYSAEFLARNPIGHVPALVIDGRCLGESVAIVEYLEERFHEPALYPRDAWARARVRQVVELVNAGVQPLQNLAVRRRVSSDAAAQKAWSAHWNERGMEALERLLTAIDGELGKGRFAVGEQFTAADLYVVPQVASARKLGVEVARFPRVLEAEAAAMTNQHAATAKGSQE